MAEEALTSVLQQIEKLCQGIFGELQQIDGMQDQLAAIEAGQVTANNILATLVTAQQATNAKLDAIIALLTPAPPGPAVAIDATFDPPTKRP